MREILIDLSILELDEAAKKRYLAVLNAVLNSCVKNAKTVAVNQVQIFGCCGVLVESDDSYDSCTTHAAWLDFYGKGGEHDVLVSIVLDVEKEVLILSVDDDFVLISQESRGIAVE